jgi:hypothetical protein
MNIFKNEDSYVIQLDTSLLQYMDQTEVNFSLDDDDLTQLYLTVRDAHCFPEEVEDWIEATIEKEEEKDTRQLEMNFEQGINNKPLVDPKGLERSIGSKN